MPNFLATTENIKKRIRMIELQLRESGLKTAGNCYSQFPRSHQNTRVELSNLDIGDREITRANRNPTEPE